MISHHELTSVSLGEVLVEVGKQGGCLGFPDDDRKTLSWLSHSTLYCLCNQHESRLEALLQEERFMIF